MIFLYHGLMNSTETKLHISIKQYFNQVAKMQFLAKYVTMGCFDFSTALYCNVAINIYYVHDI